MKHLKQLRKQKGLTQQEVAEKLFITAPAYCKIETGQTDVSLGRITQIAHVLDVSVVFLLTGIDVEDLSKQKRELEAAKLELAQKNGKIDALKEMVKLLAQDYASV